MRGGGGIEEAAVTMGSNEQGEMSHTRKGESALNKEENALQGPDGGGEESVGMHMCEHP